MDNRVSKLNVITTPDVLVAGTELFSSVYHLSRASSKAEAFLSVANSAVIGSNGIAVNTYGSYDGVTFFKQGTSTITVSTGAKRTVALAPFAPYFKVGVVSVAAGTGQASGHGTVVDLVLVEEEHEQFHVNGQVFVDATTPATDIVSITARTFFERVDLYSIITTAGTLTDLDYTVETSKDGTNWFVIDTVTNLTAAPAAKSYKNCGLLKYVRMVPSVFAGTAVIAVSLHGVGY